MAAQDQDECTATSSASNVDQNQTTKVRKPYTITKQREKWTAKEHQRFLEALKLYGRGWQQIEEHLGTKTAVQIRSHAQKFFSKVARGFNDSNIQGSSASILIPPPRPKRKPLHPYPRKCQLDRSPSPNHSGSEMGTGSPTSVLSGICPKGQQSRSIKLFGCVVSVAEQCWIKREEVSCDERNPPRGFVPYKSWCISAESKLRLGLR